MNCLATLRKMNIHNGALFPDAEGASQYCNDWLERILREEKDERAKATERAARAAPAARAKEVVEAAPDALGAVKAIIELVLGDDQPPQTKEEYAERLYERFLEDRSFEWHLADSKTAKVKTGQRRLVNAFGFPESLRDQVVNQLVDFYRAGAAERPSE